MAEAGALPVTPNQRAHLVRSRWVAAHGHAQQPFNVVQALALTGDVDVERLRRAITGLVDGNEALRVRFGGDGDEFWQCVEPQSSVPIDIVGHADASLAELEDVIARESADAAAAWLDPNDPSRVRARLHRARDGVAIVLTIDHLAVDGWSVDLLLGQLAELYENAAPRARPGQYGEYVRSVANWMVGPAAAAQLDAWRDYLDDLSPTAYVQLPFARQDARYPSWRGRSLRTSVSPEWLEGLRRRAAREQTSLYIAFLSCVAVLLRCYGSAPVGIFAPVSNRERPELRDLVAWMSNSVVLRTEMDETDVFASSLVAMRAAVLRGLGRGQYPYHELVRVLRPDEYARPRLGPQVSVVHYEDRGPQHEIGGCAVTHVPVEDPPHEGLRFELRTAGATGSIEFVCDIDWASAAIARDLLADLETVVAVASSDHRTGLAEVRAQLRLG